MVGLQGTATRDSNLTRQFVTTSLNCSLPQVCINEMDYVREINRISQSRQGLVFLDGWALLLCILRR